MGFVVAVTDFVFPSLEPERNVRALRGEPPRSPVNREVLQGHALRSKDISR